MRNVVAVLTFVLLTSTAVAVEVVRPLNVRFIAVDDLRPALGCYGQARVKSPPIDRLALQGLRFDRAYRQIAICGPSRTSLMTGLRPDTPLVVHNSRYFRDTVPDLVTLSDKPFIANGHESISTGKIYPAQMRDEENSWSRKALSPLSRR